VPKVAAAKVRVVDEIEGNDVAPPDACRKYATTRGAVLDIRRSADGMLELAIWTVVGRPGEFGRAVLSPAEATEWMAHMQYICRLSA
jgi:hypothetical protein